MTQPPLPSTITGTHLWQNTLGQPGAEDLLQAFLGMRSRTALLVGEIHRYLPGYTVHDISHLDALWEMADLIAGTGVSLTPVEGFVLGGAILLHDAAMSLAAYPGGWPEIEATEGWRDLVAARLRRSLGRSPTGAEIGGIQGGDRDEVLGVFLRDQHADQAGRLAKVSWRYKGEDLYLLESSDLRHHYGFNIGRIAHSHHWSVSKVGRELNERLGAPGGSPAAWTVDLLKVAVLLRCADAAHLDDRRSPRFLAALRGISGLSDEHWTFQSRLLRPTIEHGRLRMSAGAPFDLEGRKAWWRCYEAAHMVDNELRHCDALLADTGRPPLAVHAVAGAEEPRRFAAYVRTSGWEPVETRVRVTDVSSLVERLGGRALYGDDPTVPLRELLQNAIDAVRARRAHEKRSDSWGEIHVRLGDDALGSWLEVEDTGIGMSDDVLTGPLLDFGTSYWSSPMVREELPGLVSGGFEPIGKFGIGFFSVFMWGDRVRVTTRRCTEGFTTRVLEFETGLKADPVLRDATSDERRSDGGTSIRVWLKPTSPDSSAPKFWDEETDDDEEETPGIRVQEQYQRWPLERKVAWLCPTSDVTIFTQRGRARRRKAVKAGDWLTISDRALIERLSDRWPAKDLDGEDLEWTSLLTSRLTTVRRGRTTIARAALHVLPLHIAEGVITVGGMRAMVVHHVAGVFLGDTSAARRDEARPLAAFEELKTWAGEQAESWATSGALGHHLHLLAGVLNFCGLSTGSLPVALSRSGWMSTRQLNRWVESRNEVYLTYFGEGDVAIGDPRYLTGKTLPPFEFNDNVIAIVFEDALTGPSERFRWVFRSLFWGEDKEKARPGAYDKMRYLVDATIRMAWDLDKDRLSLDDFCFVDRKDHALGTHDGHPIQGFAIRYQRPPT